MSSFTSWPGANAYTRPRPEAERFWEKVDISDPESCWPWLGGKASRGRYGAFMLSGHRQIPAHRYAFEATNGPIPDGLELDHLCRNTVCVNPSHLEPVTGRVNTLRGGNPCAVNARKTHCKRGHEFTPENTYLRRGWRSCRTCDRLRGRIRDRERRARNRRVAA